MARWVHLPADGKNWCDAKEYEPAPPPVTPGKGFPTYFVEFDGFVFRFSSLEELDVCVRVLGLKNLPNLEAEWSDRTGPGSHWLSKLPGHVLPWQCRERAVAYLRASRNEFGRDATGPTASQAEHRQG